MKRSTRHTYYPVRLIVPAALCVASMLAVLCARAPVHAQQRRAARPAARTSWTTLFQVSAESDGAQIEPILRFAGARFEQVPDSGKGAFNKQLAGTLYKAGRQHTVIFGGGRVGTATVKSPLPDSECSQTFANVTFDAPIKLGGNVFALATDSQTLGRPAPSRRAPTPEERAAVGRLVESLYKQHGVPAARANAFDTINLTATDLDGDGTFELIGTFKLKRTPDISDMLFLIAELQGADYRAGVGQLREGRESDVGRNQRGCLRWHRPFRLPL